MTRTVLLVWLLFPALATADPGTTARLAVDAERARRTVAYLADDALEGREAGTRGAEQTIRFAEGVFRELGLEPAGSAGFRQPFEVDGRAMANVIAALPGADDAQEAIVIGAHLDHLGRGRSGSMALFGGRGEIHNGADDNASGVAAVLEAARGLRAAGVDPKRRIVFALFDGEEQGLLGSKHLAQHLSFPQRVTLMINLDMVGRLDGPLTVAGAESGGELLAGWLQEAAREVRLEVRPERAVYPNSDHYPFYEQKIPVLVPFTGLHRDYHRPSDDVDRVNAEGVAQVARLALGVALRAADAETTPSWKASPESTMGIVVEQVLAFLRLPTQQATPTLGVRVERAGSGLRVTEVSVGSAADRAGLVIGDVIVRAGERDVRGRADLRRGLQAGGMRELWIVRGGETWAVWVQMHTSRGDWH